MNVHLIVAPEYNAFNILYKTLALLKIDRVTMSRHAIQDDIKEVRHHMNVEIVKKPHVYNYLREHCDMVVVCTDGENAHATYVIKYCINHRIPILILTNLVETNTYLEVAD